MQGCVQKYSDLFCLMWQAKKLEDHFFKPLPICEVFISVVFRCDFLESIKMEIMLYCSSLYQQRLAGIPANLCCTLHSPIIHRWETEVCFNSVTSCSSSLYKAVIVSDQKSSTSMLFFLILTYVTNQRMSKEGRGVVAGSLLLGSLPFHCGRKLPVRRRSGVWTSSLEM